MSFTAPSGTTIPLTKDTTYAVVLTAVARDGYFSQGWGVTGSTDEDMGSAAGWSIADVHILQVNPQTLTDHWSSTRGENQPLRIAIRGTAVGGTTPPACTLNAGDLWCGVVTVGAADGGYGFVDNDDTGVLSDTDFSVGMNDYTIDLAIVGTGAGAGVLYFSLRGADLTAADRANLVLHVGNDSFAFSDAGGPGATRTYIWASTGLDWSSGSPVTLRLRETAAEAVTPELSVANAEAAEGDDVTFTVTLSEAATADVTVDWATSVEAGDNATSDTDFTAASDTLTFMPGDTTAMFTVTTTEDTVDEDDETFTVTLSSPTNATLATDPTATGTITDAVLPVVTIAADGNLVFEEDGPAGFTLSRTGSTAATLTVTVEVTTQDADRDLLPDGAAVTRTVTFAENSTTAALTVELEDSDLEETTGTLAVEVQTGVGYTVGNPGSATVSVADRDTGRPTPENLTALPGAGAGEVVLSWDPHASHLVFSRHQYRYKTDGVYLDAWTNIPNSGQNERDAGDGSNLTGYTVTGLAGGQLHTFQVRTFSDDVPTGDPSNEATATPRSAAVSFGAGSYSVDEGGTVEVTVQLDAAPGREVTVPVSAAGAGGATPPGETGADWSGVPENVTFGATDTAQTFTLAATDDTDVETGESVALSFGTLPAGVTAGTPSERR